MFAQETPIAVGEIAGVGKRRMTLDEADELFGLRAGSRLSNTVSTSVKMVALAAMPMPISAMTTPANAGAPRICLQ